MQNNNNDNNDNNDNIHALLAALPANMDAEQRRQHAPAINAIVEELKRRMRVEGLHIYSFFDNHKDLVQQLSVLQVRELTEYWQDIRNPDVCGGGAVAAAIVYDF